MQKRVLITGAAGFIGFHLAQALVKSGDAVLGYDNFNDYYDPKLKQQRTAILREQGIQVVEGDICDWIALHGAHAHFKPTHVVHLAAQAGVRYSLEHPQAYVQANLEGFVNILELMRQHTAIPLIYASSSSVYGNNTKVPFSEEDRVEKQASLYGVTKYTNELMAQTYHHLYGIPVTGLRFFTVYGPWGRPDMAYYSFTKAIMDGTRIDLYNNGKMQRDFTYIDDIVAGTIAAIDLAAPCEIFNLGNNKPVELLEFVNLLEQLIGKKAQKHFLPMQAGDVPITYADITHSQDKLGFYPKTDLKSGLKKFVQWYKEKIKS